MNSGDFALLIIYLTAGGMTLYWASGGLYDWVYNKGYKKGRKDMRQEITKDEITTFQKGYNEGKTFGTNIAIASIQDRLEKIAGEFQIQLAKKKK